MALPSSGSKNPVMGVIRCPFCNEVATVHETKRKGKHKYVICPSCGIDQKTGEYYQSYVLTNMKLSVNELPNTAPSLLKQPKIKPELTEPKPTEPTEPTEPKPKSTEIKPTEPTEPKPKSTEIKPTEPTEPKPKSTEPTKPTKPMNIIFIIAASVALLIGGLVVFTSKNKKV